MQLAKRAANRCLLVLVQLSVCAASVDAHADPPAFLVRDVNPHPAAAPLWGRDQKLAALAAWTVMRS